MANSSKHAERSKRAHKANEVMKAGFFHKTMTRAQMLKQAKKAKAGR